MTSIGVVRWTGVISHLVELEKAYGWLRPLWLETQEDPNENGPNQEDRDPKKNTY